MAVQYLLAWIIPWGPSRPEADLS